MIRLRGKAACLFLRGHKWRKLRRKEWQSDRLNTAVRICNRCHIVRAVKARKAKAQA